jgi:hypothetical protein
MSTRNYDASIITRRSGQINMATNTYRAMENGERLNKSQATNYNNSVIPDIKSGHTTTISKNGLVPKISQGGPLYASISN